MTNKSPHDEKLTESGGSSGPKPPPNLRIEGYDVLRELHHGGQGVVYEAIQRSTKRKVAVKVLLEGAAAPPAALKRFEREIELAAQLKHPNIITVFDSGVSLDGRRYYVMDYVNGVPLNRYVREHKLSFEETLRLFGRVCDAVQYAHQRGVIHRDLKPSNILVEPGGSPKVLDFGLAKLLSSPLETLISLTGQLVGTIPYMSPEQVRGKTDEIDARSDVYALGVILYQMLTGQYPYPVVGDLGEILHNIKESPPTPPSRNWSVQSGVRPRHSSRFGFGKCPIDRDLQTIVLQALAKERDRRYQTAGLLSQDITRYLAGDTIEAKRDSVLYALRKKAWRRKFRIAAFILIAASSFLAAYSWRQQRAQAALAQFAQARLEVHRRPEQAEQSLRALIAANLSLVQAKLELAYLLWRQNKSDEAVTMATTILHEHPDDRIRCGAAHLLLSQIYERRDLAKATEHLNKGRLLVSEDKYYRARGLGPGNDDAKEAVRLLSAVIDEEGTHFDALWARAWRYFDLAQFDDMLKDAELLVRVSPNVATAWNVLGIALSRSSRRMEDARKAYSRAIDLSPDYAPTWVNRAEVLTSQKRLPEALQDCDQAIRLDDRLAGAYALRAAIRQWNNQGDLALADGMRSLALDPSAAQGAGYLAFVLREHGKEDQAMELLNKALSRPSPPPYLYLERADARRSRGDLEGALVDLSAAIERNLHSAEVFVKRCLLRLQLGHLPEAHRDVDQAIQLDDKSSGALDLRSDIHRREGNYVQALVDSSRAIELAPNKREVKINHAINCWLNGNSALALTYLEEVLVDEPNQRPLVYVWVWNLRRLKGDIPGAKAALESALKGKGGTPLHHEIVKYLMGAIDREAVLKLATSQGDFCEVYFYIALGHLPDDPAEASTWFKRSVQTGAVSYLDYHLAKTRLATLEDANR